MATAVNTIILSRNNYREGTRFIKCTLQTEGLFMWVDKKNWPEIKDLSAIDQFKLNQSKQWATGILKTYVCPEIGLTIGHLDNPAEVWEILKTTLEI